MSTVRAAESSEASKCCGVCGCRSAVAVDPVLHDDIASFLDDSQRIVSLIDTFGSPLNIVFPVQPTRNLEAFRKALAKRYVSGQILCTTKPNKSLALLRSLSHAGAWVDVSSHGALSHALACGIPATHIQATGPKTADYLALALSHRCFITIDNPAELQLLLKVSAAAKISEPAQILLRICGKRTAFRSSHPSQSVFGFVESEIHDALTCLLAQRETIHLRGFHFHIHGASNDERIETFQLAFETSRAARSVGLAPSIINIGGGFKIRYAACDTQWGRFNTYLKQAVRGEVKPITWQGSGLGYWLDSRGVSGAPQFMDHAPPLSGAAELEYFLDSRCPSLDNQTVAQIVSDSLHELWVEPGRAIFDQSGITLGRVAYTHRSAGTPPRVYVEMNQSNLRSSQQKLLTQPIFIPTGVRKQTHEGMFLVGNLCVAQDLLQANTVFPGFEPSSGDIVAFINTAGYLMDFIESEMLHQPIAMKVAAWPTMHGWKTVLDQRYSAIQAALEGRACEE
jgi:diaminopimelate decarboxylase